MLINCYPFRQLSVDVQLLTVDEKLLSTVKNKAVVYDGPNKPQLVQH